MMTNKSLSVYVHIPFCLSKCAYCAFYSESYNEQTAMRYTAALKESIKHFSKLTSSTVETIYFGGGTPTVIGTENLCGILDTIKNNFILSNNCEITFEANPKTIDRTQAILLKEFGFNRASLGMQTTYNELLKLLNRVHTWEDSVEAYNILRNADISNISVDLMYGLPGTSKKDVMTDLENILHLDPSHISTYALSIEEGTPLFRNKDKYSFPDDDLQLEMYLQICDKLSKKGYEHYEVSNFAKKGKKSDHNNGYWERRDYIGFGSGAHSLWENKRFSVVQNRNEFIEAAEKGNFDHALGFDLAEELSEQDIREEEIMLSLRTNKGVYLPSLSPTLQRFVAGGFATFDNNAFVLTDKGFFVSNTIIYNVYKELLYDK